jgi:hypothetical protein
MENILSCDSQPHHRRIHAIASLSKRIRRAPTSPRSNPSLSLPATEMRSALSGRLDLRRLAALKPEWRVSMQALLYRAQS